MVEEIIWRILQRNFSLAWFSSRFIQLAHHTGHRKKRFSLGNPLSLSQSLYRRSYAHVTAKLFGLIGLPTQCLGFYRFLFQKWGILLSVLHSVCTWKRLKHIFVLRPRVFIIFDQQSGNKQPRKDPICNPKISDIQLNCACLTFKTMTQRTPSSSLRI